MNDLLLLHGALGTKFQFNELKNVLNDHFKVHSINFSGHGGEPIPGEPFSMELFACDVLKWMDANRIDKINIFGH
ncbi:MAG: alpha/beta hydrolase, partial [Ignavibacteriae bacterium]